MAEAPPASDPFDDLDRAYGAEAVRDPYPVFAELRIRARSSKVRRWPGTWAPAG